jgi:FkbM family methyltransferase
MTADPTADHDPATGPPRPLRRRFELAIPQRPDRPSAVRPTVEVDVDGVFFVPEVIERYGLSGYEPETSAVLLALVERLEPGRSFFDIGANVGTFSWALAAARPGTSIVGFEPTPALADDFRGIVARAGLDVEVAEIALGREDGLTDLWLSNRSDASNSLNQAFRNVDESVTVTVRRMDAFVTDSSHIPGLLKIDTESTEPDVIAGAVETIGRHLPWIVCEVLPGGATAAAVEAALSPLGYRYFKLDGWLPPVAHSTIDVDPESTSRNWLFAPHDPDDQFWLDVESWQMTLQRCRPVIARGDLGTSGRYLGGTGFSAEDVDAQRWNIGGTARCFVDRVQGGRLRIAARLGETGHHHVFHGETPMDVPAAGAPVFDAIPSGRCSISLDRQTVTSGARAQLVVALFRGTERIDVARFALKDGRNVFDVDVDSGVTSIRVAFRVAGTGCQLIGPLALHGQSSGDEPTKQSPRQPA